jgi:hypothetical protein
MDGGAAARRALGACKNVDDVVAVFADFVLGRATGVELDARAEPSRACA